MLSITTIKFRGGIRMNIGKTIIKTTLHQNQEHALNTLIRLTLNQIDNQLQSN